MYNYTTEHIVNSYLLGDWKAKGGYLYFQDRLTIKPSLIDAWVANGRSGTASSFQLQDITVPEGADSIRMEVKLGQVGKYDSEYQNALTRAGKVINIELPANAGVIEAEEWAKGLKTYLKHTGNRVFSVSDSYKVTGNDTYLTFKDVKFYAVTPSATAISKEVELAEPAGLNVFQVVPAFGDCNWIMHNLRLPSYANTRWAAPGKYDRPEAGAVYDQVTIRVRADRGEVSGSATVGQELVSLTSHVFYVKQSVVEQFIADLEGAVTSLGITNFEVATVGEEATEPAKTFEVIELGTPAGAITPDQLIANTTKDENGEDTPVSVDGLEEEEHVIIDSNDTTVGTDESVANPVVITPTPEEE